MNFQEELLQLNNKLTLLLEQIQNSLIMKQQIEKGLISVKRAENGIEELLTQLEKEKRDVEKLKSMSFANFFHTLINDKSEKLTIEEMEVLEVKDKIDRLRAEKEAESNRVDQLRLSHTSPVSLSYEYDQLMLEKTALVKEHLPTIWSEIEKKQEKINQTKLIKKEIDEAITEGKRAIDHVGRIIRSLQSAANWGTYDMMGGGMLATMAKRNHLNEAQTQMHDFQNQLKHFNRELEDVGSSIDFNIQITEFLSFADWFFDGFFVDWAVQSKINEAKSQMTQLDNKLRKIVRDLDTQEGRCVKLVGELEDQIQSDIKEA